MLKKVLRQRNCCGKHAQVKVPCYLSLDVSDLSDADKVAAADEAVKAAEDAFNGLTDAQKALVTDANKTALTDARTAVDNAKND